MPYEEETTALGARYPCGCARWEGSRLCPDCYPAEGNEDGSNRDVPPFDNDPRSDEEIKQAVYDRMRDEDDDWPRDGEE